MSSSPAAVRRHDVRVTVPSALDDGEWELAATAYVPEGAGARAPLLVMMPGAGYNRHYFDLPHPGYSEAGHHTGRGTVVVTLDHLGVGDSSIPPPETTTFDVVAAANHAAVTEIVRRLRSAAIAPGVEPIDPVCVVGAGQSMGGHILTAMQGYHRTFDGIAVLGSSVVCTSMPQPPGRAEVVIPEDAPREVAAALVTSGLDFRYAFFWEDVPAAIVDDDFAGGYPVRETAPPWGSLTAPGLATSLLTPGVVASEAASVDVPVLVAMGERDICQSAIEELAAFERATDLAAFIVPRMAHMHNFAGTRQQLWNRIDAFVTQVASTEPPTST
jgi:alpha-beta hydrolase superfamily lysophospholipase